LQFFQRELCATAVALGTGASVRLVGGRSAGAPFFLFPILLIWAGLVTWRFVVYIRWPFIGWVVFKQFVRLGVCSLCVCGRCVVLGVCRRCVGLGVCSLCVCSRCVVLGVCSLCVGLGVRLGVLSGVCR
jgi:hypothetical protein